MSSKYDREYRKLKATPHTTFFFLYIYCFDCIGERFSDFLKFSYQQQKYKKIDILKYNLEERRFSRDKKFFLNYF